MNDQNPQSDSQDVRKRKILIWSAVAVAVVIAAFLLRDPLLNWFFPERATTGKNETESTVSMSAETVEEVRSALGAYEQIRLLLAADTIDGLGAHADELAALLRAAREYGFPTGSPVSQQLQEATAIADQLREASSIEQARSYFGELSAHLIAVVADQPELRAGWHLFSCPMVEEPNNRWLQPSDEIENPFMGQAMSGCGSVASWPASAPSVSTTTGGGVHLHDGEEIAHWTCPMHPSVKQAGPGQCPICGMDLLPVSKRDIESGVLLVDDAARRRIGVKTAVVEEKPVELVIRAVGRTTFDESRLRDVTLKLKGFVERLYVNETGQAVRRGQPLLAIYSPELYSAQQEYLLALRSQNMASQTGAPNRADYLVRAARERLRLWDLSANQIRQIEERGEPLERMPILSPVSGYVIEKDVV
ncbi:MAG: efflux RND transporter periplasmic adaptor subunit, partial [Acidobacteria bacterium]|nr:efflux RND transporter periplasmic adaptor subunit [Acidobacteriota bacterium]